MDGNHSKPSKPEGRPVIKKQRYPVHDDDPEDVLECSGRSCKSCTATIVADCVALCCCPCAVINLLTLTFLKVPWMVARRCLGSGKKRRKMLEKKRKCETEMYVISRKELEMEEASGTEQDEGEGEGEGRKNSCSARFEAEKVWLELYRIGHLGFGRVSFTGIPSFGKPEFNRNL